MNTEVLRSYYLNAMGIDLWYPRSPLASALPGRLARSRPEIEPAMPPASAVELLIADAASDVALSTQQPATNSPAIGRTNKTALAYRPEPADSSEGASPSSMSETAVSVVSKHVLPAVATHWLWWHWDGMLIISDHTAAFPPSLESRFLCNVLGHFGVSLPERAASQFVWPVFANHRLPMLDAGERTRLFAAVVRESIEGRDVGVLLVMGKSAAQWFLLDPRYGLNDAQSVVDASPPVIGCTVSLSEALGDWRKKRLLWEQMTDILRKVKRHG